MKTQCLQTNETQHYAIERQNNELRSMSKILNKNRAELTKIDEDITSIRVYFEILTFADVVESNLDFLIEIKIDSMKGFCSDRALSKEFLVDHLLQLEANKVGLGPIFSSWEWNSYYKNRMCTVALEGNILWVTIRIPIVKKAEKLIRTIPTPRVMEALSRAADYGLDIKLFKEKNNEKFHAITQTSLDLCNQLGNTRTCGVRDIKFMISSDIVIPVEFALNRVIVVGVRNIKFKVMSKCPNGITEHVIDVDSVWTIPNNCSYSSNLLSIETRESDVEVTEEIGIIHVEKFEFGPVHNVQLNNSELFVNKVLNSSSNKYFEKNRNDILTQLSTIDTKHRNLSSIYAFEKWLFVGGVLVLLGLFAAAKIFVLLRKSRSTKKRRSNLSKGEDIEMTVRYKPTQQQTIQTNTTSLNEHDTLMTQNLNLQKSNEPSCERGHVYAEIVDTGNVSFSSKPEFSQFYKK